MLTAEQNARRVLWPTDYVLVLTTIHLDLEDEGRQMPAIEGVRVSLGIR